MDLSGITDIFGNQDFDSGSSVGLAANDMFGGGTLRQAKLAKEQMKWQSEENLKDRIHQMGIMGLQNMYYQDQANYDFNIWKNQFDLVNGWNTPKAQAERLMAAGVNPSVIFSGQAQPAAGGMSSQSAQLGSTSVPTGGSPHSVSPVPGISGSGSPGIGILNAVTSGLRQLAEAKKLGIDTRLLEDTYNEQVKQVLANTTFAENEANLSTLNLEIEKANLPAKKKVGILQNQLLAAQAEAALASANESNFTALKESCLARLNTLQADMQEIRNKHGETIVRAEIANVKSMTFKNTAEGKESLENINLLKEKGITEHTIQGINRLVAESKHYENDQSLLDLFKRKDGFATECKLYISELNAKGVITDKEAEEAKTAANDAARVNNLSEFVQYARTTLNYFQKFVPLARDAGK